MIQAYLRDAERDLRDLIEWGRQRGTRFTVRLVKGAYWDYEKIKAAQNGWRLSGLAAKAGERRELRSLHARSCSRTKSSSPPRSVRTTSAASRTRRRYAEQLGIDKSRFEFQLLYGMAGPIKRALVEMGYRVREYSPGRRAAARHVLSR